MADVTGGTRLGSIGRRCRGGALRIAAAVGLAVAALALAALVGGLVPANAGWRPPPAGVAVFVRTNGVHTWIMVPKVTPWFDWRGYAPAGDIADPARAGDHLAIGFGNRRFYLETPTWADLDPMTALAAAAGRGGSLVHVDHEDAPVEDEWQKRLIVSPADYRRLSASIARSFARGADGRPILVPGRGFDDSDAFYVGAGRYDLLNTCNSWTGARLREAGIRTGRWTPLAQSITWRL